MEKQIQKFQEQSSSVVLRQQGKKYSLNDLGTNLTIFSEAEEQIIDARKRGAALCDQTPEEFEISLTGIIFSVSVICGCQLPTHEVHINALEKEFGVFLKDNGYFGLTTEEILTAFRMNANFKLREKIETYNAIFNIDYASKVLRQYLGARSTVDQKAIELFYKRDVDTELNELSNARRLKVIQQYEIFFKNDAAELDLSNCFMQLREDYAFENINADKIFEDLKYGNVLRSTPEQYETFLQSRFDAEKKAVRLWFAEMKKQGNEKIYDENLNLLFKGVSIVSEEKK